MSYDTRQIIQTICPELAVSPSINDFLVVAVGLTDKGFFGKMYSYAVAYRACHIFTITPGNGSRNPAIGVGQIASMSEGSLSVSFVASATTDISGLDTTKYGKMLLNLIKSRPTMGVNKGGLW
jgi:hypothetical protein